MKLSDFANITIERVQVDERDDGVYIGCYWPAREHPHFNGDSYWMHIPLYCMLVIQEQKL